jgi:hypothetical protein
MTSGPVRGRERRTSLLFDATDFSELTARETPPRHPASFSQLPKGLASTGSFTNRLASFSGSFAVKRTASVGAVLNAFSKLPPEEQWLKSGIVERQTVSSDMVWLPRLMVLTESDIIFAKEGSDIILDRLALQNVTFIGKVPCMQAIGLSRRISHRIQSN